MAQTFGVPDAAKELGITQARVRQLVAELNLGQRIGPRLILLSKKDVDKMRERKTQRGPVKKR